MSENTFNLSAEVSALTAKFTWRDACPQSDNRVFRISVRTKNDGAAVAAAETSGNEFRIVIAPGTDYVFRIESGETTLEKEFRGEENFGHFDDTNTVQKFGKARKGAVYCYPCEQVGITALPEVDETQALSPWYAVKEFTQLEKPSFAQVRDSLPEPVLGEEDEYLKDAYYYAWKIAFDEWLVDPPDRCQSVFFNNCCTYWAGQGSGVDYDTSFIMMYAKYALGAFPYYHALDNIYARQHENGFIIKEGTINNFEVFSSCPGWAVTGYLAWSEWELYLHTGDAARIANVFMPLAKYYEWHRTYMERADGSHPDVQARHGDWEVANEAAYLIFARHLQKMAALIGRGDCAAYFDAQAKRFMRRIEETMWDEANGMYNSRVGGAFSTTFEPGAVYRFIRSIDPLMTGEAAPDRAAKMLDMLLDPERFNGRHGVNSLSRDSTHYMLDAGQMIKYDGFEFNFKRTVWSPSMVFAMKTLKEYGRLDDAAEMAERHVRALAKIHADTGDIWEYSFTDELAPGGNPRFVGWAGYGPIAMFIEHMLGFSADAPSNTLTFTIRRDDEHGMRKLRFGATTVGVICGAKVDGGARVIRIATTAPFTLRVIVGGVEKTFNIRRHSAVVTL